MKKNQKKQIRKQIKKLEKALGNLDANFFDIEISSKERDGNDYYKIELKIK